MRKCEVCGSVTSLEKSVEEVFNMEGHLVLVENIPARACARCGEVTFARTTVEHIRRLVHGEKPPSRCVNVDVFAYA
jgi:HTH-type transcriptional regulator/antitoxin MqsA